MKPGIKTKDNNSALPLVLLAEDDAEMRIAMCNSLSVMYHIIEASDGEVAISLTKQHLPDIIVFDFDAPGFGGNLFLHALRNDPLTQPIPVLLLFDRARHRIFPQSDAQAFLGKPFIMDELHEWLLMLLRHRAAPGCNAADSDIGNNAANVTGVTDHPLSKHFKEVSRFDIAFLEKLFQVFEQEIEKLRTQHSCPGPDDGHEPLPITPQADQHHRPIHAPNTPQLPPGPGTATPARSRGQCQ